MAPPPPTPAPPRALPSARSARPQPGAVPAPDCRTRVAGEERPWESEQRGGPGRGKGPGEAVRAVGGRQLGSRRVSPGERLVWDRDEVCRQAWGWGCPSAPGWAPVSGVSRHPRRCAMACLSLWGGGEAVEPLAAGACERPGYGWEPA